MELNFDNLGKMNLIEWITQIVSKSMSVRIASCGHFFFLYMNLFIFLSAKYVKKQERNTFLRFLLTASVVQF